MTRDYTALIRTFNCEATLGATLASLASQTRPPAHIVIVDSGSTDRTLELAPAGSLVHRYEGGEFNYSAALNQGIALITTPFTLVISAHTTLEGPRALDYALTLLEQHDDLGAAYFVNGKPGVVSSEWIDGRNFDGFNGLWNTCSVLRTPLARKRGFRPEVFSAEDQEWASWLFAHEHKRIARISGCGMSVNNPRKASSTKRFNEYVSVAYFSHRRLLAPRNVLGILKRAVFSGDRVRSRDDRLFDIRLSLNLMRCWFAKPRAKSKYF